mmetsp:Transcript_69593/g.193640  ORF Transcript_69593/g.193640 Transcript_69593/m.193640 type:complete len:236 (-) Transcript_69593:776-1483(-)
MRGPGEALRGDAALAERVARNCIESSRYEDRLRLKLLQRRRDDIRQRLLHFVVAVAYIKRHIDRRLRVHAARETFAASAREELASNVQCAVAVHAEKQDAWVVAEDVLGAIPVVHIPIDYGDLRRAMHLLGVAGGDGDVVKEAKASPSCSRRVVTRRADDSHAAHDGVRCIEASVDEGQRAPDCEPSALWRACVDEGILVAERLAAKHLRNVAWRVCELQLWRSSEAPGQHATNL